MTPTEKKYSKLIGNMYWEDVTNTHYDGTNDNWITQEGKQLIMVVGIKKGNKWGQYTKDFYYIIDVLQRPFPTTDDKPQYYLRCKNLQECLDAKNIYHPVDSHDHATV